MLLNIEHEPTFLGRPQLVGFHKHFEHRCPQGEILGREKPFGSLGSSRVGKCGFLCWKSDIFAPPKKSVPFFHIQEDIHPAKTNIEPENDGLKDDVPLPGVYS